MKKTILGISFLIMAAFAGSAYAQNPENANCNNPESCKKEQCDKKCDKKGRKDVRRDPKKVFAQMQDPFEGLNLSDAQKEKVKDLDLAMKTSRKEMFEKAKEAKAENGDKKDGVGKRENFTNINKELRSKYLTDLQKILSEDQYIKFLQNFYVNQQPQNAFGREGQRFGNKIDVEKRYATRKFDESKKAVSAETKKAKKAAKKAEKAVEKKVEEVVK